MTNQKSTDMSDALPKIDCQGVWKLVRESVSAWLEDRAASKGAAIAFYTLFSLAPLLVIAIAIAGAVYGEQAARGEIMEQVDQLVGREGAAAIQAMIENAGSRESSLAAGVLGALALLVASTTVFAELKDSLDQIWRVERQPGGGMLGFVRTRLLSFSLVLAIGFLLLVSLVLSAALAAFGKYWGALFTHVEWLLQLLNFAVSFAIITVLFAVIYRVLPGTYIAWRDVWVGAAITSLLFAIGKTLIGLYLGKSGVASTYGAAGSLILVLLWVYYSAQIFLLGAEFTRLYAHRYGSRCPANRPGNATSLGPQ